MKIDWTYATLVALSIAIIVSSVILKYTVNRQQQHTNEGFDDGINMLGSGSGSSYENAFGDSRTFATQNFGWDDGLNAEFNTWFNTPKDTAGGGIGGNSFDAPPAPSGSGSCRWVCDTDDMNQYHDDQDDTQNTQYQTPDADDMNQYHNDQDDTQYQRYQPVPSPSNAGPGSYGQCAPGYEWDGQECLNMSQAAQDNNVAIWTPGPSPLPPSGPLPGPAPAPVPTPGPTPKPGPKPASKGTWVTITAVNEPIHPMTGAGHYVIVSYVNPTTKKNGTVEVRMTNDVNPASIVRPQPLPSSGQSLAKAGGEKGGVGGQLLLSPTGEVIDGRPKPGSWVPLTSYVVKTTASTGSNFTATYIDPVMKKSVTLIGRPYGSCPDSFGACVAKAGDGGSILVSPTGEVIDGRPKPGPVKKSTLIQGTVTSNPSSNHFVATYKVGAATKTYAFTNTTGKITKNQIVALTADSSGRPTGVSTIFPARGNGSFNVRDFQSIQPA